MAKKAFVFPGQASQFVGMGKDLYSQSPLAREIYERAAGYFDFDLKTLSFEGPLKDLTQTRVAQPAIFVLSIILFEELKNRGYLPDLVAGHSLGEYSALVAAGAFSFLDGLQLVKLRAEEMQKAAELTPGTMAAVIGLERAQIQQVIDESTVEGVCQIANLNAPSQIVISGDVFKVQSLMGELKKAGAKLVIELTVGGAFHSALMNPAQARLQQALEQAAIKPPSCPVYCNVSGKPTTDPEEIRQNLISQLTAPVLWVETITNMLSDGAENFVEVGPGKVLQNLIKRIAPEAKIQGIGTYQDLEQLCS
jgi:[acyl-carrier-protein] S-malonyltransferase